MGVVTTSGFGDGGYMAKTQTNQKGAAGYIEIKFVDEYDPWLFSKE